MPDKFNMTLAPFNRLTKREQARLRQSLDVAYFREYDTILSPNQDCEALHIVIKGAVEETNKQGTEVFAHYTPDDMFDVRAQLDGITIPNQLEDAGLST